MTTTRTTSRQHARTFKGVTLLKATHPQIRQLKQQGNEAALHGNKVWNSSFTLMEHFTRHPLPKRSRVLDIGCGWGPMSVFLASKFGCRVTGIDADKAMKPYLDLHASINGVKVDFLCRRFEKLTAKDFQGVHTIVGADICFWDELSPILFEMTRKALKAGVKQVIIADPGRTSFWRLARKCEKQLEAEVLSRRINRPVRASTELLVATGLEPVPAYL